LKVTTAIAREDAKKGSEQHAVSVGEFAREYLARAKGSATAVRYHGIAVNGEEICRRILTDLPPHMHFIREGFVLRMNFPVVKLEHALVKVGELKKRPDGSDGNALAAGFKPKNHQGGQKRGRSNPRSTRHRRPTWRWRS